MKPSRHSIQCAAQRFITSANSRSPATAANYQQAVNRFLKSANNHMDSVGTTRFLQSLTQTTLKGSSKATYISGARAFLKHLTDEGLIPTCPLHLLKRPRISRSRVNYLSEADAKAIVAAAQALPSPATQASVVLMLGLGLRVSEAIASQWRHLYQESGAYGLLVPSGKGGASRVAVVPQPILEQLQGIRRKLGWQDAIDGQDPHWILEHDGQPYCRQRIHGIIQSLARQAIRKPVGPHTLRHSFATLAARAGAQPYDLQESLGHQKLETTMLYIHLVRGLANPTSAIVADRLFGIVRDVGTISSNSA